MQIKKLSEAYLTDMFSKRRESTVCGYESSIRLYINPVFGDIELESLTTEDIQDWVNSFELAGAAEKAYKTLRQLIRWAIRKYSLRIYDPTTFGVDLPDKQDYQPRVLSAKQTKTVMEGFKNTELEAVVLLALSLGLRRGEVCGLKWSDINVRTGRVKIERSRQSLHGETILTNPKTKKSKRTLVLPQLVKERLRLLKKQAGNLGFVCGEKSPNQVAYLIKRHCLRNKLPYVSMTNMRHTWATLAVESGVQLEVVAMMLGHSNISTAFRYYVVLRDSICAKAQRRVNTKLKAA